MRSINWSAEVDYLLDQLPQPEKELLSQILSEYLSVPIEKRTDEHIQKATKAIREIFHKVMMRDTLGNA
jgi:hypothetical protein